MSRKCTALLILIGIIQFGITVQTAQVDWHVQNGERNCLELMPDFAKKNGESQTRNNSDAYTVYDAKKKNPNQCINSNKGQEWSHESMEENHQ